MRAITAGLAAVSLLLGAAAAQEDHLKRYQAFADARTSGDREAMLREGEAAWRAAEREVGDVETTALLAQNLLYETIWTDPEGSVEVASRALALGRAGLGTSNMTLTELTLTDAFARSSERFGREEREALLDAFAAYDDQNEVVSRFSVDAYNAVMARFFEDRRYGEAYDVATALTELLDGKEGVPPSVWADALLNRATVLMADGKPLRYENSTGNRLRQRENQRRYEEQLRDAGVLISRAIDLFPSQTSIDDFESWAARAFVWRAVAGSLFSSYELDPDDTHRFEGHGTGLNRPMMDRGTAADGEPLVCEVEWESRPMRYPRMGSRDWYNGGVLIGYHLSPDGDVIEPRVLAEVPADRFGEAVLRYVAKWEADTEGLDPACLRDQLTTIQFTVR